MATSPDSPLFEQAAASLPSVFWEAPLCQGMILGSGWSRVLSGSEVVARISYDDIFGLGLGAVEGHAGELLLLERNRRRTAVFCGRRHWYEGVGWSPVVLPVELLRRMGAGRLLLTNAAGGVNPSLRPGDLMLLADHINLARISPLEGALRPGWGPRFPDQSAVYAPRERQSLQTLASERQLSMATGLYAFTPGPAYETPAEIRAYGLWGIDAVGMSTVPEAMVANAMGMRVTAVSCITNMAAGISDLRLTHEEVLQVSSRAEPRMRLLLELALEDWP